MTTTYPFTAEDAWRDLGHADEHDHRQGGRVAGRGPGRRGRDERGGRHLCGEAGRGAGAGDQGQGRDAGQGRRRLTS